MRNKLLFLALPLLFGLQASAQHTQAFQDTTLSDEPVSYTHLCPRLNTAWSSGPGISSPTATLHSTYVIIVWKLMACVLSASPEPCLSLIHI